MLAFCGQCRACRSGRARWLRGGGRGAKEWVLKGMRSLLGMAQGGRGRGYRWSTPPRTERAGCESFKFIHRGMQGW